MAAMMGMNETLAGVTIVVLGNASPDIAGGFAAFGQMNGETSRIVFNSLLRYLGLKFVAGQTWLRHGNPIETVPFNLWF